MTDILTNRALNRALLSRQLLLSRSEMSALDTVDHLIGMQAQAPQAPYVGLWTRLTGFEPSELSELMMSRDVVRLALMRGTVHLVTASDALFLRPLLQPLYDRIVAPGSPLGKRLSGVDLDKVVAAGRELIEASPRTAKEIRDELTERWPGSDADAIGHAIRSLLACVQVPPRGIWRGVGQATVTTAESWLGRPLEETPSPERMVLRYLTAYGPASVMDMQAWCGLTRLGEIFEGLRPNLRVFRSEEGRELFDVPEGSLPSADVPAPIRFLPEYDNCLRSHSDRSHVMSLESRERLATRNDSPKPILLVDGFVRGAWKLTRSKTSAVLSVELFKELSKKDASAVTAEGRRLLKFVAPDSELHDVQL